MENLSAVLSVKFHSIHEPEKLMAICHENLEHFRNVPGLIQKYYLAEKETGAISGIYLFSSLSAREAFWTSELAKTIPAKYGVISESLRVEKYETAIVLNEISMA